jgi:hypothetical protein
MPVFKAKVVVSMLAEYDNEAQFHAWLDQADLGDVLYEITDGEMVGSPLVVESITEVPREGVINELLGIGNDGTFFGPITEMGEPRINGD